MKKCLLSGNEAIARGAHEAGVKLASAYPGTPSTEILENITQYKEIDASWAPNEKVALEVGIGATFGGARALVTMKHVGVNVAADPLFSFAYAGVRGGLVLVTADDPELHSSQNEQDNRHYARFAKVPMLEPSDSQEAKDFTRLGFEISEKFDMPVMLRTTTRISHSKSIVTLEEPVTGLPETSLKRDPAKLVMLPGNARRRHPIVEENLVKLGEWSSDQPFNRVEEGEGTLGVITSGISYQYAREVYPDAPLLKIGLVHPLPTRLIEEFAARFDKIVVIEELDPYIEDQVKAMGIDCVGKDKIPLCGELTPGRLANALEMPSETESQAPLNRDLPNRPPNMCPGCPHRGVFMELSRAGAFVTGDIGCYTLGFMPPLNAMDTCICMGASIGNATGLSKVLPEEERNKVVGVIGDSTFLHTGINGLMDMVYNKGVATVVILDNRITAMTGRQDNPASGWTLQDERTFEVDMAALCRAVGVKHVVEVDPYDLSATRKAILEEMSRDEASVVIAERPCMLMKRDIIESRPPLYVKTDDCTGCKACLKTGCPAIEWDAEAGKKGQARVTGHLCVGCGFCRQTCKFDAIGSTDE